MEGLENVHIALMENTLLNHPHPLNVYDLKGSLVNRITKISKEGSTAAIQRLNTINQNKLQVEGILTQKKPENPLNVSGKIVEKDLNFIQRERIILP